MKLSDVTTKLTCMKSKALRVLAAATLAGATLAAATPAAQAQQFAIGVQFGGPRYVAPAPVYFNHDRNFYERQRIEEARRREEFRRQEEFRRHQQWDHDQRFHNDGYNNGFHGR